MNFVGVVCITNMTLPGLGQFIQKALPNLALWVPKIIAKHKLIVNAQLTLFQNSDLSNFCQPCWLTAAFLSVNAGGF